MSNFGAWDLPLVIGKFDFLFMFTPISPTFAIGKGDKLDSNEGLEDLPQDFLESLEKSIKEKANIPFEFRACRNA